MGGKLKLFIILFIFFIAALLSTYYFYTPLNGPISPISPISKQTSFSSVTIGATSYGSVIREGPYGNPNSSQKIAIITGVHPLEHQAHTAFIESLKAHNSTLKECYYIYKVNVTLDAQNYQKGRNNGQKLAYQYVVPDIEKQGFNLVIDVHNNRGNYQKERFLSVPATSPIAQNTAYQIVKHISWLSIYNPPNPTSPTYVTIPLIKSGTPAIIYETYMYEPYSTTRAHADQFITVLDQID
jgi:hypothetical protein